MTIVSSALRFRSIVLCAFQLEWSDSKNKVCHYLIGKRICIHTSIAWPPQDCFSTNSIFFCKMNIRKKRVCSNGDFAVGLHPGNASGFVTDLVTCKSAKLSATWYSVQKVQKSLMIFASNLDLKSTNIGFPTNVESPDFVWLNNFSKWFSLKIN